MDYKKLEKLMDERGVTIYQVSKNTGVATATLYSWRDGIYTPKVDKVLSIANYFEVPLDYFLGEQG